MSDFPSRHISETEAPPLGPRSAARQSLRAVMTGIVLLCMFFAPSSVSAQQQAVDIERIDWGFDGRVVPYRFNVLSVLVRNNTAVEFDGTFRLSKTLGSGERVGAPIEERVYLSPYTERWVQFYPYVMATWEEWRLAWGRGAGERIELPQPAHGRPAHVLLEDPDNILRRGGQMKRFPENLFPPMVTATDALQSVVMDHAPRWEEARRQSFLDWLHRGGTVHLVRGDDGRLPEFPPTLADLNSPLEKQRVGAGFVYRHQRSRNELDRQFVRQTIFGQTAAEIAAEDQRAGATGPQEVSEAEADRIALEAYENYRTFELWDSDSGLFNELKKMTRADHNWGLIYFLSLVYVLMIFPGCWLLGRNRVDYRLTFAALLGTVALFSMAFLFVGHRGYGESTAVSSVAFAKPLANGRLDVTQWSNVFVTAGDDYEVTHHGSGTIYSTAQQTEAVNGLIQNGAEAKFLVDIPPFSSRTFAHRTLLSAKPLELGPGAWQGIERLEQFSVEIGENFPQTTLEMYALYRDRFYKVVRNERRLESTFDLGSVPAFLRFNEYGRANFVGFDPWGQDERSPEERYAAMLQPLLARSLGVAGQPEVEQFSLPDDRVRLFVYAPMTDDFFTRDDHFGAQAGYVLYSFDVFK